MRTITHNESQKHDDITDTFADAIEFALIDKVIYNNETKSSAQNNAQIIKEWNEQRRMAIRPRRN